MDTTRWNSPRFLFGVQVAVWTVVFVVLALNVDLARGKEVHPTCPSIIASLKNQQNGIPFNLVGLAEGLIFIGFLWYLTGVLAWVYTRWPRWFLVFRVTAGRVFGPSARRAGPLVTAAGITLLGVLQIGCEISG